MAASDGRRPDRDGKLVALPSTVDVAKATYTNTVGSAELTAEWVDAEFDPTVAAVYYARVIEIATPRWSTYLAVRNGLPGVDGSAVEPAGARLDITGLLPAPEAYAARAAARVPADRRRAVRGVALARAAGSAGLASSWATGRSSIFASCSVCSSGRTRIRRCSNA